MLLQCSKPALASFCKVSPDRDAIIWWWWWSHRYCTRPLYFKPMKNMFIIFLMAKGLSVVCACETERDSQVFIFKTTCCEIHHSIMRGLFITLIFQLSLDIWHTSFWSCLHVSGRNSVLLDSIKACQRVLGGMIPVVTKGHAAKVEKLQPLNYVRVEVGWLKWTEAKIRFF